MKTTSFNNELKIATVQFGDIFNYIAYSRGGRNIKTVMAFGNRSRIFKDLENPKKGAVKLPLIIISRTGLSRDTSRVSGVNEMLKSINDGYDYNVWAGNPVNIEFKVTVTAKEQSDIEHIISNFTPFFNPDVYVRMPHPKISGEYMNLQVVWDGTIDEEWPEEIEPSQHDLEIATMNFTLKTFLFGGTTEYGGLGKPIQTIRFTLTEALSGEGNIVGGFYPVEYIVDIDDYYDDIVDGTVSDPIHDEFVVSGE